MKNIKTIFFKKKVFSVILLCLFVLFFAFFRIKQISFCSDLSRCDVETDFLLYKPFLDSLDLFVIKGGEGNISDYFFYDGFRIHCLSDSSSHALIDTDKVWDGKYEGNGLVYLRPYIADDVYLYRVRKFFNTFYLVEKNEDLTDATYWFFSSQACKKSFLK